MNRKNAVKFISASGHDIYKVFFLNFFFKRKNFYLFSTTGSEIKPAAFTSKKHACYNSTTAAIDKYHISKFLVLTEYNQFSHCNIAC